MLKFPILYFPDAWSTRDRQRLVAPSKAGKRSNLSARLWVLGVLLQRRKLMILRAYIDDSDLNQAPVSVLAGWIGPAATWAAFADAWKEALEMKPFLQYFKMNEAMSLSGQFFGWTEESRDFRLRYLINLIQEYKLIGVGTVVPHAEYREVFFGRTDKSFDMPYHLMFHSLMSGIVTEFSKYGLQQVDFVFDEQPGQMERMAVEWSKFKNAAPPQFKSLLGDPPAFRNDETTLPLQAADMYAWYVRAINKSAINGEPEPPAPWAPAGGTLNTVMWPWKRAGLERAYAALTEANRRGVPVEIWGDD